MIQSVDWCVLLTVKTTRSRQLIRPSGMSCYT